MKSPFRKQKDYATVPMPAPIRLPITQAQPSLHTIPQPSGLKPEHFALLKKLLINK